MIYTKFVKPPIEVLSLFLVFSFFPLHSILAQELLIVEIQIGGEKTSDDFIKIYNPTDSDIYLGNYRESYLRLVKRTKTSGKDYTIKSWFKDSKAKIPAGGFYLWANKDYSNLSFVDSTTSQTIAPNNGIALRLGPENTGEILDAVGWGDFNNLLFEGNPFPENPPSNYKLKRKLINITYQDTNNNSQDFYLESASELAQSETETFSERKIQSKSKLEIPKESEPITTYPSGIIINEILPDPKDLRDAQGEFIEIFNKNKEKVNLSGWKIADKIGKEITVYTFPENTLIEPENFLVFYRTTTKIILNNEGDSLSLIQPDGKIADSLTYDKAPKGQSYNRNSTGWEWSDILTPGSQNKISLLIKTEKVESLKKENEEKIDINTASLKDLVKIIHLGEQRAQELISQRPFYSLDELTKIKGLTRERVEDIKKQGLAWINPELKPSKIEKVESPERELATIVEPLRERDLKIPKSFSTFLIALTLAIFSGVIILILKINLKNFALSKNRIK